MSKFGRALGEWELNNDVHDIDFILKPKMTDIKLFRNILLKDENRKKKDLLFEKFNDFMFNMMSESYPEQDKEMMKESVELNSSWFFEEAMIAFRWTTREEADKTKLQQEKELKKLMSDV